MEEYKISKDYVKETQDKQAEEKLVFRKKIIFKENCCGRGCCWE